MTFIDSNVSFGHWPFAHLPKRTLSQLASHLQSHGIEQALVSPIETLFLPDPDPSNRELIKGCQNTPSLIPIPVLNLANGDWQKNLHSYQQLTNLKAVKLYPNFHRYSLESAACAELVQLLKQAAIPLILNIRMEDERFQYHGLKIDGVFTKQLPEFTACFPDLPILCTGLYRPEILEIAASCPNLRFDLAFADWHKLLNGLLETIAPERLFFGSHTPLMVTKANTYKLETADISPALKQQIASENAKAFFRL